MPPPGISASTATLAYRWLENRALVEARPKSGYFVAPARRALPEPEIDTRTGRAGFVAAGLALAACDKCVQIVYERELRPPEKRHEPWLARVTGQLLAARTALDGDLAGRPPAAGTRALIGQPGVSIAVAWRFIEAMVPHDVPVDRFARLAGFSAAAERTAEFLAAPYGDGPYRAIVGS